MIDKLKRGETCDVCISMGQCTGEPCARERDKMIKFWKEHATAIERARQKKDEIIYDLNNKYYGTEDARHPRFSAFPQPATY